MPFGRYRLTECLGKGGMAIAYRAVMDGPQGFSRSLVIKRMRPELSQDPAFVRMLIGEARLSAQLLHPGIVQVHELGNVGDEYYLAMELVDGSDLWTILKHCNRLGLAIPPRVCCYLIHEIACALAYAHTLKDPQGQPLEIVHRDVSPANIMITRQGGTKLLDFGIAKAANCVSNEHTRTGTLKGKLSYMSPEQAAGRAVDLRTDIFALGIVFHECLTMRPLFRGNDDLDTLRLVREANISGPASLAPDIDADIDAVVMKMLAREPTERYSSCEAVAADLATIAHRLHGDAAAVRAFLASIGNIATFDQALDPELERVPTVETTLRPSPAVPPGGSAQPITAIDPSANGGGARRVAVIAAVAISVSTTVALWLPLGGRERIAAPAPPVAPAPGGATPSASTVAPGKASSVEAGLFAPSLKSTATALAPTDRRVRLVVTGHPGARVLVDGRDAGVVPFEGQSPSQHEGRTLVVSAPGFHPYTQTVAGNSDVVIAVHLTRRPSPKPVGKRSASSGEAPKDPFAGEGL